MTYLKNREMDWNKKDLKALNFEETVEFCRSKSMFRVSVLGYAQLNAHLAYQEYIDNRNPNENISYYFNELYDLDREMVYHPDELRELFAKRNKELK